MNYLTKIAIHDATILKTIINQQIINELRELGYVVVELENETTISWNLENF